MKSEIDLRVLKNAVNAVLDHLIEDVGLASVPIEDSEDFYWELEFAKAHDVSTKPLEIEMVGRLTDDAEFMASVSKGFGADSSYNLIHIAPLLRFIGEKVKN
jgi:hypothetical protein